MKRLLFIFATVCWVSFDAQTYQWARGITSPVSMGNLENVIRSVATDAAGNVYVTGNFVGTNVDFNPGGTPVTLSSGNPQSDIFFAKYSTTGTCIWAKAIVVGSGIGEGTFIAIGPGGDICITGYFSGPGADFDPGPGTAILNAAFQGDIFVARYDASGNYLWAIAMGGPNPDASESLSLDAVGNVYITGRFQSPVVDFDPGPGIATLSSAGGPDIFFAKYDAGGNYLWARAIGSAGNDISNSISVDASSNVYITGYFQGSATDFDPGPGTATLASPGTDIFFAKYDAGGNYLWVKSIPLGGALSISAHTTGVYITGNFKGINVDFDPGPSTAGLSSGSSGTASAMFLAKYDHNGSYLWANAVENSISSDMVVDALGKIYIIGGFSGTTDFDPGPGTATLTSSFGDVFFAKYNANGNYIWAKSLSNPNFGSNDYGYAIALDVSQNVFIGGAFTGANVDFDPGPGTATLSSPGNHAMFLAKYDYCGQQFNNPRHICLGQSYAVNGNIYTTSGIYTDTLYTSLGCDSVVVTQLTVSGQPPVVTVSSSSVLCSGSANTLTAGGAVTYTWSTGAQAQAIVVTPTDVTQYIVAGTGTNGCTVNNTIQVTPSPTLGILIPKPAICQGEQITITASGASSYTWSTGAQTPSISASLTATTEYTVTGPVTGSLCMGRSTATVYVNSCVGLNSNSAGAIQLTVYPNPVNTELFYKLSINGIHRFTITDCNGITLAEGEERGTKVRLDVSAYPPGIYNLTITLGKTSINKRFLVEKRD